ARAEPDRPRTRRRDRHARRAMGAASGRPSRCDYGAVPAKPVERVTSAARPPAACIARRAGTHIGAMTQKTPLSEFLPYQLSITSNAVSGRIALEYRQRFGLSVPEWRIMAVLGDAGPL